MAGMLSEYEQKSLPQMSLMLTNFYLAFIQNDLKT